MHFFVGFVYAQNTVQKFMINGEDITDYLAELMVKKGCKTETLGIGYSTISLLIFILYFDDIFAVILNAPYQINQSTCRVSDDVNVSIYLKAFI